MSNRRPRPQTLPRSIEEAMHWRLLGRDAPPADIGHTRQTGTGEMFPDELDSAIDNAVRVFRATSKPDSGKR